MKRTPNRSSMTNSRNPTNSTQYSQQNSSDSAVKRIGRAFADIFFCKSQVNSTTVQSDVKRRRPGQNEDHSYGVEDYTTCTSNSSSATKYLSYGSSNAPDLLLSPLNLSFDEIRKATGNFSSANQIGEGGFGTVYKGKLKDGSFIAVKRAYADNKRLSAELKNEILNLSKIEHYNLVRILGYLEHGQEKVIVIEHVSNGTLREHLDGSRGNELEIAERLDVAIDVAQAITYLHTYMEPPIIHRDIKSSNVLITERLRAKVADFGIARLASKDQVEATHAGYLDPEYLKTYQVTDKSDVYSFGVLLTEMITGRHPIEEKKGLKEKVTLTWALRRLKEGETVIAMDPRIRRNPASIEAAENVLKLVRECVASSRNSRPPMKKCVEVLWGIRNGLKGGKKGLPVSIPHYSYSTTSNVDKSRKNEDGGGGDLYEITDSDYHRFNTA